MSGGCDCERPQRDELFQKDSDRIGCQGSRAIQPTLHARETVDFLGYGVALLVSD